VIGLRTILAAAALAAAAGGAGATGCGTQRDFLVSSDPVLAPVRPADCARVLPDTTALAWPAVPGAQSYIVTLTRPDGRVDILPVEANVVALEYGLSPGVYRWRVSVAGSGVLVGEERSFLVQPAG
jgi:hypothetical protein